MRSGASRSSTRPTAVIECGRNINREIAMAEPRDERRKHCLEAEAPEKAPVLGMVAHRRQ